MLHRAVQRCQIGLLELRRRLPRRQFCRFEDLVGRLTAQPRERAGEKLPEAAGVALARKLSQRFKRHLLRRRATAIGQRGLDHERIATVDGRRPRRRGKKFTRHHLPEARQQPLLADRHHAVGGRWWNLCVLNGLEDGIGLTAAELARRHAGRDLGDIADPLCRAVRDPRERLREELRERDLRILLQHCDQAAQFHAIRMRLDLLRLRRQVVGGAI